MSQTTNRVDFDEASHSYTNMNGEKYISATTIIGKYKQPFDSWKVATAYAKKNGETAAYWVDAWEKNKLAACAKGTAFHKKKEEDLMETNGVVRGNKVVQIVDISKFTEPNINYSRLPDGIYPELRLWDHYWHVAGTSDIVEVDGEYFDMDDHKTNKKIDKESYIHPKEGRKMMNYPLSGLMDCNLQHYELQLSLYAYMFEKLSGKKCRNLTITHYTEEHPHGLVYPLKYRKLEVLAMLLHYTGKPAKEDISALVNERKENNLPIGFA